MDGAITDGAIIEATAVSRGEMVAIMGPSGCGKTTLLNKLSGLDDLTSGEVLVEGAALHRMSDRERTPGVVGVSGGGATVRVI